MPSTSIPFYLDWTFWSFVVAAIAIVLSQLPPVRQWFRGARLSVEVYGKAGLSHLLGHPNLGVVIGVRNTGGQAIRVRAIRAQIIRHSKVLRTVDGNAYFPSAEAKAPVVLTPFLLQPGGEWIHAVRFVELLAQPEDRALGQLRADVRLDIGNKARAEREVNPDKPQLVEASPELVKRMETVVSEQFIWTPGEYEVEVRIFADDGNEAACKYRFTLYESDTQYLRKDVDGYKHGLIVAVDNGDQAPLWVSILEVAS